MGDLELTKKNEWWGKTRTRIQATEGKTGNLHLTLFRNLFTIR